VISPLSYKIVGTRVPNKLHHENYVDAQFSAYYQTAVTWLDGSSSGWKIYDRLLASDVAELSERVWVVADEAMSELQAKLEVVYEDGPRETGICDAPRGEASNPLSAKHIEQKYLSLAVPVLGRKRAESVQNVVDSIEDQTVVELMSLVAS
jgi:2-methylcitrate dehydratase PrpD